MNKRFRLVAALATAAAVAGSGTARADELQSAPPVDTAKMEQSIRFALGGGRTMAYSYGIAKNGQHAASGAQGIARWDTDGEDHIPMTKYTRMEVASVTKNFTAAAILRLLEANGLTPDTKIWPYLPSSWVTDESWEDVTFAHLLSHRSGFNQTEASLSDAARANWTTLYSGLNYALTIPTTVPSPRSYSNMNYALLRVILPRLWRMAEPGRGVPVVSATNSGSIALAFVNEKFLAPAGITATSCQASNPSTAALAYDATQFRGGTGVLFQLTGENAEACAGHRGLFLSAMDMLRWQVYLRRTNVVSDQVRSWMDTSDLGWQPGSNNATTRGMWFHDGDLLNGGQLHTCVAKFPGGVEASVMMNSQNLGGVSECQVLIDAYNAGIS